MNVPHTATSICAEVSVWTRFHVFSARSETAGPPGQTRVTARGAAKVFF